MSKKEETDIEGPENSPPSWLRLLSALLCSSRPSGHASRRHSGDLRSLTKRTRGQSSNSAPGTNASTALPAVCLAPTATRACRHGNASSMALCPWWRKMEDRYAHLSPPTPTPPRNSFNLSPPSPMLLVSSEEAAGKDILCVFEIERLRERMNKSPFLSFWHGSKLHQRSD